MKNWRSIAWVLVGGIWLAAFFSLGARIGGVHWIKHTGQTVPAALNIAMAALSFGAAYTLHMGPRISRSLGIPIALLAGVHLINLVTYMFLLNGAGVLSLLGTLVPTNTQFMSVPSISYGSVLVIPYWIMLFFLPVVSLVLVLIGSPSRDADA